MEAMIDRAHLEAERGEHTHYVVPTTGEKRCCLCLGVWPCEQSEILDLALAAEEREQQFGSLLARIHRDGGHYISAYGWRKAGEDAEEIVLSDRTAAERAEGYRKALLHAYQSIHILVCRRPLVRFEDCPEFGCVDRRAALEEEEIR